MRSIKSSLERMQELLKQKGNKLEEKDIISSNEEFENEIMVQEELDKQEVIAKRKVQRSEQNQKRMNEMDQIRQLVTDYDLQLDDKHLEELVSIFTKGYLDAAKPKHLACLEENLKLAELINFLDICIFNRTPVTFSTTVKAEKKSITLNQPYFINHFWRLANTLLEEEGGEKYSRLFKWSRQKYDNISYEDDFIEFKKDCDENDLEIPGGYMPKPKIMLHNSSVYGDYQISKIIEHEKKEIKYAKEVSKKHLKLTLNKIVSQFVDDGLFKSGYKTIAVNEASFLYDVMVILKIIETDGSEDKQEKYDYIKRRLTV